MDRGEPNIPMIPGVIPDDSPESLDWAMREAHEVLPFIPGTTVVVFHWTPVEGFEHLRELGWDRALAPIRELLAQSGPKARITVCARYPHEMVPR